MTDEELTGHFTSIQQQFAKMHDQFGVIDQRFEQIDRRFEQIDQRFGQIDRRFEQIDQRFGQIDQRFEKLELRFNGVDQAIAGLTARTERLETEVHSHGVLLEELNDRVTLVAEGVATLQTVTDAKFGAMYERIDQRLDPLERVVRSHSEQLARHESRLQQ